MKMKIRLNVVFHFVRQGVSRFAIYTAWNCTDRQRVFFVDCRLDTPPAS